VRQQEGYIKELSTVHPGSWLMDNNLLACGREHVEKVFSMLLGQSDVKLLGGLDVRLLRSWHVEWLSKMKLKNLSIAYDVPGVEDSLVEALQMLHDGGISHGVIRCFVLAGFYSWDTPKKAEERCRFVLKHGATPFAMVYRNMDDERLPTSSEWAKWSNLWKHQRVIYSRAKREGIPTYQETLKCK
jgi:hypothetical protein